MYGRAYGSFLDKIMTYKHVYQVLASEITILTDSVEIYDRFKYVSLGVEQVYDITRKLEYEITSKNGRYLITENGKEFGSESDIDVTLDDLFSKINTKSLDYMDAHIRIHSGSASYNDKYFLVVGEAEAGKTTFMTSLIYDDFDVHGDELTLLKNGEIVTYPRKLYIRDTSLPILPEFAKIADTLPFVWNTPTVRIFAFDPMVAGKNWKIEPTSLEAIFFIHKNHGSKSRLEECPKYKMVQQVMTQATAPINPDGNWLGDLCKTIDNSKTFDLHLGEIGPAMRLIKEIL